MSARRPRTGRPTALTPALQRRLLLLVERGNYRSVAARACGVAPSTVKLWIARGQAGAEPYATFLTLLAQAEAAAETRVVGYLLTAARRGDAKALQLFLQQRFPKRWRRGDGATAAGAALAIPAVLVAPRPDEG